MEAAFRLKEEMVEKGVSPDAFMHSSLIRGLCEANRLDDAYDLFKEMLDLGLRPDEFTYTTLIHGHCKQGDVKKALLLHDEMVKKGILPDVVTYNVLINGLSKIGRMKEARRLLFRLYYEEQVPDKITYDTLVDCCDKVELKSVVSLVKSFCMQGLMDEADRVFDSIEERTGMKPNEAAYNVLIHGHCRGGNVRKALSLYKEMMEQDFVPSAISTISLIRGLSDEGMSVEVNQVIHKLMASCLLSDAETSKILVEVNHKDGNMEAVLDVLTEMAKDGLLPASG
ncbi:pentatricopeptide repeat-containing protein [Iris pallida]|uniref:Pentatricopeptide repeat-containing protein n=1 Tax=Iris pallida TaxID=29817 RepID=A0AAX6GP58_IRIPA|nr:pentatricopeptide repeat-containing protein [Iris pallida]KAJ6830302.1 pentatricopeptide repeat-containing protein [Iris pallida]KAJ6830303.1 pentatricopeptide repeat-containing protein [Iris pallida]